MDVMFESVAGLDVHKKTVVVCVRRVGAGGRVWKEVRTFSTRAPLATYESGDARVRFHRR